MKHRIAIRIVSGGAQVSCSACQFGRLYPSTARAKAAGAAHEAAMSKRPPVQSRLEEPGEYAAWEQALTAAAPVGRLSKEEIASLGHEPARPRGLGTVRT